MSVSFRKWHLLVLNQIEDECFGLSMCDGIQFFRIHGVGQSQKCENQQPKISFIFQPKILYSYGKFLHLPASVGVFVVL